jgi:hypothetical protein
MEAPKHAVCHVFSMMSSCQTLRRSTSADSLEFNVQRLVDQFGVKSTSKSLFVCFLNAEKLGTSNRDMDMLIKKLSMENIVSSRRCLISRVSTNLCYQKKLGELRNLKYVGLSWTGLRHLYINVVSIEIFGIF